MRPETLRRSLSLLTTLAALAALVAVTFAPGSQAAPRKAPCSKSALTAGLKRGADATPGGRIVKPYACAGSYAYAAVIVKQIEITVVFRAQGSNWTTVDREHACNGGAIPSNIYKQACETN